MAEEHPKRSFHLISVFDDVDSTTVRYATRKNGYIQTGFFTLRPGEDYSLDDGQTPNDDTFINSLKSYTYRKRYSTRLEQILKDKKIPYTIDTCKACGGRAKKIVFHPVEVVL